MYGEFISGDSESDSDYETVTNDTFNNESIMESDTSSLPSSFLNEFGGLKLTEERMLRKANEVSSIVSSATTSTITSVATTITLTPIITSTIAADRETKTARKEKRIEKKREKAISKVLANIERSMEVDLCYVLDCTGSMSGHIAAAKDCILQVTEYINDTNPSIKTRFGFCGYRDHCDGTTRLQVFDFTDSCETFRENLTNVPATGGGDGPEDVLGGLNAAVTQMTWRDGTRVLLHIGDYPPHGRRFTSMADDYPAGDPNGLTAEGVLEKMKSENILYFFGKITNRTETMIQVFRSIIGEIPVFDLAGGDPTELINKFTRAATSSITISVSLTSTLGSRDKNVYTSRQRSHDLNPDVPDWDTLTLRKGVILCYPIPKTLDELKEPRYFNKGRLVARNFSFKIAPQAFSSGGEKRAYFALNTKSDPPKKVVMKEYLIDGTGNPFERYLEAVEISSVASFLSIKFNLIARRKNIRRVNFLDVSFIRASIDDRTSYYTTELELQDAKYERFNVNSGLIVKFRPTLEAFAHFTYEYTGGYLVVCDLQGIELPDRFLLTDPAIHCIKPLRFGKTNLGGNGINRRFVVNHKCNEICKKLGLTLLNAE
ncbi:hypothetical protein Glove_535g4 [Diversispora epigaea]|uniref:Alpha-type protein kinase domain-containing protein n=1 Tax=Diversispora epigaea TaxID=1348612 RepID=A0A397GDG1_9GLOM|nr:hypothetical protein Glove_535g4 [Diversispora epigaea]